MANKISLKRGNIKKMSGGIKVWRRKYRNTNKKDAS